MYNLPETLWRTQNGSLYPRLSGDSPSAVLGTMPRRCRWRGRRKQTSCFTIEICGLLITWQTNFLFVCLPSYHSYLKPTPGNEGSFSEKRRDMQTPSCMTWLMPEGYRKRCPKHGSAIYLSYSCHQIRQQVPNHLRVRVWENHRGCFRPVTNFDKNCFGDRSGPKTIPGGHILESFYQKSWIMAYFLQK